ncbi:DUF5522 domain-containing protein [Flavihumibacter profundi]|uniref:DUF5522 domain-containing protein n=1 Tax=Flavihumibacter profundi TaxID=2716883 RepID=UPI001CC4CD38|nr:DUF5522 domain-containing protein [Flavihumibacter profundi]MBZ5858958.1 DUF5522 domain-containing protein [Flavihumibacter profundi]
MKKRLIEGIDFYYNKEGFIVLTEKYHLEKGVCCGNGCLHCPYDYIQVEEPRRSHLLLNKVSNHGQVSEIDKTAP